MESISANSTRAEPTGEKEETEIEKEVKENEANENPN